MAYLQGVLRGHVTKQDLLKFGGLIFGLILFTSVIENTTMPSDSVHQSVINSESFVNELRKTQQEEQPHPHHLPAWGARNWCDGNNPFVAPDYEAICNPNAIVNLLQLQGSTPSAMRTVLLGGMLSIEQNRCFVVDDPSGFIADYFEPIGLPRHSDIVQRAIQEDRLHEVTPQEYYASPRVRRIDDDTTKHSLYKYHNMNGHLIKKYMLHHLFQLQIEKRDDICDNLDHFDFANDEFLVMAPMRHRPEYDKIVRGVVPAHTMAHSDLIVTLANYVKWAKIAFDTQFDSRVLPIYVVTDECSTVKTLRDMEPTWTIVSECDNFGPEESFPPVELWNNAERSESERVDHLHKHFVDLYAAATSSYYIGLGSSDFSWISYFMRGGRSNFILLDKTGDLAPGAGVFDEW